MAHQDTLDLSAQLAPLLDPEPLTMLHRRGVALADLDHLRQLFYDNIHDALVAIRRLPPASTPDDAGTNALQALTHRVRGACASMGADALGAAFEELGEQAGLAPMQLAQIDHLFETTRLALDRLLSELASKIAPPA